MKDKKTVFISYSWEDRKIAYAIDEKLQGAVDVHIDKRSIRPLGDIREFMSSIKDNDYAVIIISSKYLKSQNCMYELTKAFEGDQHNERILTFVTKDARIYKSTDRIKWRDRWQKEYRVMKKRYIDKDIDPSLGELKYLKFIATNTLGVLDKIARRLNPSISKDKKSINQAVEYILQVINSPE